MIQLSYSSIVVAKGDGTSKVFDPEDIQAKIINSLLATGAQDIWIAEDLSLAVEHALQDMGPHKTFTMAEIDSLVVKALREVGFTNAAEHYHRTQHEGLKTVPLTEQRISDIVARFLGVEGALNLDICAKITKTCSWMGLQAASPSLVLELARHFHHQDFNEVSSMVSFPQKPTSDQKTWVVCDVEILSGLTCEARGHLESGIIHVSGISSLFPSVKITLSLCTLATASGIEPPVTELALMPCLETLSCSINDVVDTARKLYHERTGNSPEALPAYLKMGDPAIFSRDFLNSSWPETAKCLAEILESLASMLDTRINLRNILPGK